MSLATLTTVFPEQNLCRSAIAAILEHAPIVNSKGFAGYMGIIHFFPGVRLYKTSLLGVECETKVSNVSGLIVPSACVRHSGITISLSCVATIHDETDDDVITKVLGHTKFSIDKEIRDIFLSRTILPWMDQKSPIAEIIESSGPIQPEDSDAIIEIWMTSYCPMLKTVNAE